MRRRTQIVTACAILATVSILLSASYITGTGISIEGLKGGRWGFPGVGHGDGPVGGDDVSIVPTASITLETPSAQISEPTKSIPDTTSPVLNTPTPTPASTRMKDYNYTIPTLREGNATLVDLPSYLRAISDPADTTFDRLACPSLPLGTRYNALRSLASKSGPTKVLYFFALDLHQNVALLPRLLGSIVEAMRFLGPESCVLSIVEGRSTDGTFEVLAALRPLIEDLGALYFFNSTDIDPSQGARIAKLAELRNMALAPMLSDPTWYSIEDTNVIFLNDVAICSEDILELLHQRIAQSAAMTCAMDWTYVGEHPTFYDVWIARDMAGETFFNIPPDGNWDSAWNLFWANDDARARYNAHLPFQVFSCWNGAVVFSAKPILEKVLDPAFHATGPGECFRGEPEVFCKELWKAGYGRIAVVPSVNLEYSDGAARKIKELKGYTRQWVGADGDPEEAAEGEASWRIGWVEEPPKLVKCMASYENQSFVPWDEGL